jgi:hypothetical protein
MIFGHFYGALNNPTAEVLREFAVVEVATPVTTPVPEPPIKPPPIESSLMAPPLQPPPVQLPVLVTGELPVPNVDPEIGMVKPVML